jgi:predicted ABC-class ATPase
VNRVAFDLIRQRKYDRAQGDGGGGYHSAKGGDFRILQPCQQVLETSSVLISDAYLEIRLQITLPAFGRKIASDFAHETIVKNIPYLVKQIWYANIDQKAALEHVLSVEDQESLRVQLRDRNLVAFIVNGAILPRKSGDSDLPLKDGKAKLYSFN